MLHETVRAHPHLAHEELRGCRTVKVSNVMFAPKGDIQSLSGASRGDLRDRQGDTIWMTRGWAASRPLGVDWTLG